MSLPPEATFRSVAAGCVIGALLGAGNLYMGLKTGWSDSGNFAASLLGFAFFGAAASRRDNPYSPLENNLTQTVAVVCGTMSLSGGLLGAIPALEQMGHPLPGWALVLWGGSLGTLGILLASVLRKRLIVEGQLPFPTGLATAELIRTLHSVRTAALTRLKAMGSSAAVAATLVWFRDGFPALIPAALSVPGSIAGVPMGALTLGLSCAPMLAGAGALVGLRTSFSILGGALFAWGVVAPQLLTRGLVHDPSYTSLVGWLVWPGTGLILGASAASLVRSRGSIVEGVRDVLVTARAGRGPQEADGLGSAAVPLALIATGAVLALGVWMFGGQLVMLLLALVLSVLLAGVCARSAGQTDISPMGAMGQLGQVALATAGVSHPVQNLAGAAQISGLSSQVSNSLWCMKSAEVLGARNGPLLWAQLGACWLGALISVPLYKLLLGAYTLGSAALPSPSAAMHRALAETLQQGGAALPAYALGASVAAFVIGAALELGTSHRFTPLPLAIGVGFIAPASYAGAICLGALLAWAYRRWRPEQAQALTVPAATGAILGESLAGVAIAVLRVAGII